MKKTTTLTFHGGAGSVTGANFLLEDEDVKILVDCGLFQGCKFCEDSNREAFPYDPSGVDILLITHAHIDHIGRIPLLVQKGFSGTIYSTPATQEIAEVMLIDSMGVLEKEAQKEGKEPLYSEKDVNKALSLWKTIPYHTPQELPGGFSAFFKDAGHILGSAMIELSRNGKKIVFTGDLGNSPAPLLRDTEVIDDADYMVMESVYGDRNHDSVEMRTEELRTVIEDTVQKGGALLIPAFSIERTQILLYELNNMIEKGVISEIPVFLDSPLAIKVTEIYKKRIKNFKKGVQEEIKDGDDIFVFPKLKFTEKTEESKGIADVPNPKIIIAGSGMSNGGRILHHEKRHLPDSNSTLLLVGYQAAGSLGRQLQEGAKEVVIHDKNIPIRANVVTIPSYSAHKDMDGLIDFVAPLQGRVKKVFVAMGEPKSSLFLVQRLRDYLGIDAVAPEKDEKVELEL